jgi:hypothetical protein
LVSRLTALAIAFLVSFGVFNALGSYDGPKGFVGVQAVAKAMMAVMRKLGVNVVPTIGVPPHAHQAYDKRIPQNEKNTLFFL